jgi:hypothetical protein
MGQAALHHAPPNAAQEIKRLQDLADEVTAFNAMHEEIEAAAQALEAHRADFEALMEDGVAALDRATRLFSEERFLPMRYTAADVHRAFETVGYPSRYRTEPHEEDMEIIVAAIVHLANMDQRLHLARQLMMLLPEYVSAGRYLDAWLIQYSAFQMSDAPDKSNPFLFVMFDHGFAAWASEVDEQQEGLLRALDIDRSEIAEMSVEEAEAWLKAQIADPAKEALLEAYYAAHPMMSDQAEAELMGMERNTLRLLERDDADCLYLSPEEVDPWVPMLVERLTPIEAQARQAAEREDWEDTGTLQAMGEILVEVAQEMVPVVFTSERLGQLVADLKAYRRNLLDVEERAAAAYVHGALLTLERENALAENPLLIAVCFASLRLMMITISEEARAQAEGISPFRGS